MNAGYPFKKNTARKSMPGAINPYFIEGHHSTVILGEDQRYNGFNGNQDYYQETEHLGTSVIGSYEPNDLGQYPANINKRPPLLLGDRPPNCATKFRSMSMDSLPNNHGQNINNRYHNKQPLQGHQPNSNTKFRSQSPDLPKLFKSPRKRAFENRHNFQHKKQRVQGGSFLRGVKRQHSHGSATSGSDTGDDVLDCLFAPEGIDRFDQPSDFHSNKNVRRPREFKRGRWDEIHPVSSNSDRENDYRKSDPRKKVRPHSESRKYRDKFDSIRRDRLSISPSSDNSYNSGSERSSKTSSKSGKRSDSERMSDRESRNKEDRRDRKSSEKFRPKHEFRKSDNDRRLNSRDRSEKHKKISGNICKSGSKNSSDRKKSRDEIHKKKLEDCNQKEKSRSGSKEKSVDSNISDLVVDKSGKTESNEKVVGENLKINPVESDSKGKSSICKEKIVRSDSKENSVGNLSKEKLLDVGSKEKSPRNISKEKSVETEKSVEKVSKEISAGNAAKEKIVSSVSKEKSTGSDSKEKPQGKISVEKSVESNTSEISVGKISKEKCTGSDSKEKSVGSVCKEKSVESDKKEKSLNSKGIDLKVKSVESISRDQPVESDKKEKSVQNILKEKTVCIEKSTDNTKEASVGIVSKENSTGLYSKGLSVENRSSSVESDKKEKIAGSILKGKSSKSDSNEKAIESISKEKPQNHKKGHESKDKSIGIDTFKKSEGLNSKEKSVESLNSKEKSVESLNSKEKSVESLNSKEKSVESLNSKKSVESLNSKEKSVESLNSKEKSVESLKDTSGSGNCDKKTLNDGSRSSVNHLVPGSVHLCKNKSGESADIAENGSSEKSAVNESVKVEQKSRNLFELAFLKDKLKSPELKSLKKGIHKSNNSSKKLETSKMDKNTESMSGVGKNLFECLQDTDKSRNDMTTLNVSSVVRSTVTETVKKKTQADIVLSDASAKSVSDVRSCNDNVTKSCTNTSNNSETTKSSNSKHLKSSSRICASSVDENKMPASSTITTDAVKTSNVNDLGNKSNKVTSECADRNGSTQTLSKKSGQIKSSDESKTDSSKSNALDSKSRSQHVASLSKCETGSSELLDNSKSQTSSKSSSVTVNVSSKLSGNSKSPSSKSSLLREVGSSKSSHSSKCYSTSSKSSGICETGSSKSSGNVKSQTESTVLCDIESSKKRENSKSQTESSKSSNIIKSDSRSPDSRSPKSSKTKLSNCDAECSKLENLNTLSKCENGSSKVKNVSKSEKESTVSPKLNGESSKVLGVSNSESRSPKCVKVTCSEKRASKDGTGSPKLSKNSDCGNVSSNHKSNKLETAISDSVSAKPLADSQNLPSDVTSCNDMEVDEQTVISSPSQTLDTAEVSKLESILADMLNSSNPKSGLLESPDESDNDMPKKKIVANVKMDGDDLKKSKVKLVSSKSLKSLKTAQKTHHTVPKQTSKIHHSAATAKSKSDRKSDQADKKSCLKLSTVDKTVTNTSKICSESPALGCKTSFGALEKHSLKTSKVASSDNSEFVSDENLVTENKKEKRKRHSSAETIVKMKEKSDALSARVRHKSEKGSGSFVVENDMLMSQIFSTSGKTLKLPLNLSSSTGSSKGCEETSSKDVVTKSCDKNSEERENLPEDGNPRDDAVKTTVETPGAISVIAFAASSTTKKSSSSPLETNIDVNQYDKSLAKEVVNSGETVLDRASRISNPILNRVIYQPGVSDISSDDDSNSETVTSIARNELKKSGEDSVNDAITVRGKERILNSGRVMNEERSYDSGGSTPLQDERSDSELNVCLYPSTKAGDLRLKMSIKEEPIDDVFDKIDKVKKVIKQEPVDTEYNKSQLIKVEKDVINDQCCEQEQSLARESEKDQTSKDVGDAIPIVEATGSSNCSDMPAMQTENVVPIESQNDTENVDKDVNVNEGTNVITDFEGQERVEPCVPEPSSVNSDGLTDLIDKNKPQTPRPETPRPETPTFMNVTTILGNVNNCQQRMNNIFDEADGNTEEVQDVCEASVELSQNNASRKENGVQEDGLEKSEAESDVRGERSLDETITYCQKGDRSLDETIAYCQTSENDETINESLSDVVENNILKSVEVNIEDENNSESLVQINASQERSEMDIGEETVDTSHYSDSFHSIEGDEIDDEDVKITVYIKGVPQSPWTPAPKHEFNDDEMDELENDHDSYSLELDTGKCTPNSEGSYVPSSLPGSPAVDVNFEGLCPIEGRSETLSSEEEISKKNSSGTVKEMNKNNTGQNGGNVEDDNSTNSTASFYVTPVTEEGNSNLEEQIKSMENMLKSLSDSLKESSNPMKKAMYNSLSTFSQSFSWLKSSQAKSSDSDKTSELNTTSELNIDSSRLTSNLSDTVFNGQHPAKKLKTSEKGNVSESTSSRTDTAATTGANKCVSFASGNVEELHVESAQSRNNSLLSNTAAHTGTKNSASALMPPEQLIQDKHKKTQQMMNRRATVESTAGGSISVNGSSNASQACKRKRNHSGLAAYVGSDAYSQYHLAAMQLHAISGSQSNYAQNTGHPNHMNMTQHQRKTPPSYPNMPHQVPRPDHQVPRSEHQVSRPEHQVPRPEHQVPRPDQLQYTPGVSQWMANNSSPGVTTDAQCVSPVDMNIRFTHTKTVAILDILKSCNTVGILLPLMFSDGLHRCVQCYNCKLFFSPLQFKMHLDGKFSSKVHPDSLKADFIPTRKLMPQEKVEWDKFVKVYKTELMTHAQRMNQEPRPRTSPHNPPANYSNHPLLNRSPGTLHNGQDNRRHSFEHLQTTDQSVQQQAFHQFNQIPHTQAHACSVQQGQVSRRSFDRPNPVVHSNFRNQHSMVNPEHTEMYAQKSVSSNHASVRNIATVDQTNALKNNMDISSNIAGLQNISNISGTSPANMAGIQNRPTNFSRTQNLQTVSDTQNVPSGVTRTSCSVSMPSACGTGTAVTGMQGSQQNPINVEINRELPSTCGLRQGGMAGQSFTQQQQQQQQTQRSPVIGASCNPVSESASVSPSTTDKPRDYSQNKCSSQSKPVSSPHSHPSPRHSHNDGSTDKGSPYTSTTQNNCIFKKGSTGGIRLNIQKPSDIIKAFRMAQNIQMECLTSMAAYMETQEETVNKLEKELHVANLKNKESEDNLERFGKKISELFKQMHGSDKDT